MKKIFLIFALIVLTLSLAARDHHGGRRGHRGGGRHGGWYYGSYYRGPSGSDRGLWRANQIVGIVANGLGILNNLTYPSYYYPTPTVIQTPPPVVVSPPPPPTTVVYPQTTTVIEQPTTIVYPRVVNEPIYQYQIINGQRVLVRIQ